MYINKHTLQLNLYLVCCVGGLLKFFALICTFHPTDCTWLSNFSGLFKLQQLGQRFNCESQNSNTLNLYSHWLSASTTKWARNHQLCKHRASKAENQTDAHKCFPRRADKAVLIQTPLSLGVRSHAIIARVRKRQSGKVSERDLFGGEQSIWPDYSRAQRLFHYGRGDK